MSNYALVIDTNKQPLSPCHPSVARKLLDSGKAAVFRRYPFTIAVLGRMEYNRGRGNPAPTGFVI